MAVEIIVAGKDRIEENDEGYKAEWWGGYDYLERTNFSNVTITNDFFDFKTNLRIGQAEDCYDIEEANEILEPLGFKIMEF